MKNEYHYNITHLIAVRAGNRGEPLLIPCRSVVSARGGALCRN